jgi:tetratricopeptide (TPR) repeat protein
MKFRVVASIIFCLSLFSFAARAQQTKDAAWTRVVSPNFELVGNANKSDIEQTAVRLEQFRQIFRQIYPQLNAESSTPLRVVIFKSPEDFKPYKIVRADGAPDEKVMGYFAAGSDINYIALPLSGDAATKIGGTIFHEYVHFLIGNNVARANVPAWLNEGLAEFYENLRAENDRKIVAGEAPLNHLRVLQTETLLPLENFLAVDNFTLHNQGDHGRTVFYVQAWAFLHFLNNRHRSELTKFLDLLIAKTPQRAAFAEAFQKDLTALEAEFKTYVEKRRFEATAVDLNSKLETFETKAAPFAEAEALAVLGDLLLHINRPNDALVQLERSLALDANLPMAHAALAMTQVRRGNFAEAKQHLEKALTAGAGGFLLPYYYAFVLCREDFDGTGFVSQPFSTEKTRKVRALVESSIALNPNFAANYQLLAFVNQVNGEDLPEAVRLLEKAIRLDPGNQSFQLELAELHVRLENYDDARRLAASVFLTAAEKTLRNKAHAVVISVDNIRELLKRIAQIKERPGETTEYPVISQEEGLMRAFNEAVRKPLSGEQRVLGYLEKIDCSGKGGVFSIRAQSNAARLRLNAANLQQLRTITFVAGREGKQLQCGERERADFVVATFKNSERAAPAEIVSLEFVPENFRFLP